MDFLSDVGSKIVSWDRRDGNIRCDPDVSRLPSVKLWHHDQTLPTSHGPGKIPFTPCASVVSFVKLEIQ